MLTERPSEKQDDIEESGSGNLHNERCPFLLFEVYCKNAGRGEGGGGLVLGCFFGLASGMFVFFKFEAYIKVEGLREISGCSFCWLNFIAKR
jgi:hypothetical protein